jgi:hypothetical protein
MLAGQEAGLSAQFDGVAQHATLSAMNLWEKGFVFMIGNCRFVRLLFPYAGTHSGFFRGLIAGLLLVFPALCAVANAQTTTISGTVYMPNGTNVLPNALVYITTSTPAALVSGANCPGVNCLTASTAVPAGVTIYTYTAVDGTFSLSNVSESTTYTLVIQAGHWRRQYSEEVGTSAITGLSLSMPSTHAQGDIPLIAISTGSKDAVECVFHDLGVNNNEVTDDTVSSGSTLGGRIHLYKGDHSAGAEISASTPAETALMGGTSTTPLSSYDMVMFPCQGSTTAETTSYIDNLLAYTNAGGRAFVTHDSRVWINTSTSYESTTFSGVATWLGSPVSTLNPDPGVATVNTSFTDGSTLAQWLYNGGYSDGNTAGAADTGTLGQVEISTLRWDLSSINAPAQSWLTLNDDVTTSTNPVMQFSFNTPFDAAADAQFGRVLFNEYHVENVTESGNPIFPAECPTLTTAEIAQEKMLEYALFDLSNFVTPIVLPTVSIAITTDPSNSIFMEGDTDDTITVDVTDTSETVPLSSATVLNVTLPAGLTATAMTDTDGGWICTVGSLSCTRTTTLAASASDSVVITVTVAGNATGGATSTTPSVSAVVSNPTFSSSVTEPLTLTLQQHAAVTWATPAAIADGTALSSTQLNAVGNTAGTYAYTPVSGTVLSPGSHTLSVIFTPTDQETYPGTGTASVTLVVDSPVAATASAPAAANFGPIPVGTASSSQSMTFTFLTGGVIGSPVVVTQGATGLDFADTTTGTCDTNGTSHVYSGDATCTVNVIFTPQQPGIRYGAVLLEDGSGSVLATAYIYGIGLGPQLDFDAAAISTIPVTFLGTGTSYVNGVTPDSKGNLYLVDETRCIVEEYAIGTGMTSLIAGISGTCTDTGDGGLATDATFNDPSRVAINGRGDLFISDSSNAVVRKIDAITGIVTVVAGISGQSGYSGDGVPATSTKLTSPQGVVVDGANNLYIADSPKLVRRVDAVTGLMTTAAGNSGLGTGYSGDGALAGFAQMNHPLGLAIDGAGNLYIADDVNNVIRKVTASTGYISTVAGQQYTSGCHYSGDGGAATSAQLCDPEGLAVDAASNIYIADSSNNLIRKVSASTGVITTAAGIYNGGTGTYTGDGGSALHAGLNYEQDIAVDGGGNLYLDDANNSVIRKVIPASGIAGFAAFVVTTSSPAIDVTVSNNGNATLDVSALTTTANFNLSGSDTTCTGTTALAAGASCVLGIEFRPTAAGSLTGTTTLTDNVNNVNPSNQSVALSGTGTGGEIALQPSSSTLAAGTVGILYSGVTFTASGGTAPYGYSYTGTLPPGLTLSSSGVLAGTPTTAGGSYTFTVIATDTESVTGSHVYSLTISLGAATVTLGNLAQTYTGMPLAASATTSPTGLTVGSTYTGIDGTTYGPSSTPPTAAGSYTVVGTVSNENYTGTATGTLVISKAPATVTLSNLAQTYTGSPLAASATTSPVGLTVGLTYTGADGTTYGPSSTPPTAAGSYTVVGTVSNQTYTGTATGTLVISKAPATVTLGNLAQTYTGSPLAASATTSPVGLTVGLTYTGIGGTTYGPSSTPPIALGSYTVVGTVSNQNYTGTAASTLVISKAPATVTLGNLAQTYTGSPLAASATTSPAELTVGLTYTGADGTTYGPSSTPPTAAGSYIVAGTVSNQNYTGTATGTLVISKAPATVTLGNLAQTYTGSPLAASATTSPVGLTVGLTYTGIGGTTYGPSSTPPIAPGSYTVVGTVSNANYTGTATGTLVIAKKPATVTLGGLAQSYTGLPLAATATTNPSGLKVNLTYNHSSTAPSAAGSYTVVGAIDDLIYAGSATGTLVISQLPSATTVSSSANPVLAQTAITFTATVSAALGTPTGAVTFLDGTTALGQGALTGLVATLSTSSLAAGSHAITAVYGGDTNFAASTSSVLTQSVLNFSLTSTSGTGSGGGSPITSQTAAPGGTATYPLLIAPTAGISFPAPVVLTVSGMPPGATAAVTPSPWTQLTSTSWSFPAQTPMGALSLAIELPPSSAHLDRQNLPNRSVPPVVLGILLLPFAGRLRALRKRLPGVRSPLLLLAAGLGALAALTGCGATSGLFGPQQQQTYTVTVTAVSGTLSHSTTLTLTVK